jgi:hypothetical protein
LPPRDPSLNIVRYLASTNTRYAGKEKRNSGSGCKFQITDRSKPIATVELRYKDETSLKLLGASIRPSVRVL